MGLGDFGIGSAANKGTGHSRQEGSLCELYILMITAGVHSLLATSKAGAASKRSSIHVSVFQD